MFEDSDVEFEEPDLTEARSHTANQNRIQNSVKEVVKHHPRIVKMDEMMSPETESNINSKASRVKRNLFECDDCDFTTNLKSYLKLHIKNNHSNNDDDDTWHECESCQFKTKNKQIYKHHVSSQHQPKKEIKVLECDFCSFQTRKRFILKKHVSKYHRNE